MTGPAPSRGPGGPSAARTYGPEVGEPALLADPRRWGSLVGLIGGLVFIGRYSSVLGPALSMAARTAGVVLVLAAPSAHYVWPVALGPMARPRRFGMVTYVACVAGELALTSLGSKALTIADAGDLRPGLIAAVVGLHFVPLAWAFHERMFVWLGGLMCGLGATGVLAGALGVAHAAEALAVLSGLVMLMVITAYASGRFAPRTAGRIPR